MVEMDVQLVTAVKQDQPVNSAMTEPVNVHADHRSKVGNVIHVHHSIMVSRTVANVIVIHTHKHAIPKLVDVQVAVITRMVSTVMFVL
jgi:hypothetical protein